MIIESLPFDIAHCSSFEEGFEPDFLIRSNEQDSIEQSRGWQTQKYPGYPQNLIVQLKDMKHVCKVEILSHHYKTASKIDLYYGTVKDQVYIEFIHLGFVTFDNNNRFHEQEMKSIKIQVDCEYLCLVIRGCHENRLNAHKQVGVLALNILGRDVTLDKNNCLEERIPESNLRIWIKAIQDAENQAAQDENYKEAKIYKDLYDRLLSICKLLCDLEYDKKTAASKKDYDGAEEIKNDILQVMKTAESLLTECKVQMANQNDIVQLNSMKTKSDSVTLESYTEDRLLDGKIKNASLVDKPSCEDLEPLTKEELESCRLPQSVFGTEMVTCIMSVKTKYRTKGLTDLSRLISETAHQQGVLLDLNFIQSSLLMLQESIMDSREAIFIQTINVWRVLYGVCDSDLLHQTNVFKWIERFFSSVLSRTLDTSSCIHAEATKTAIELIQAYHKGNRDLLMLCIKDRVIRTVREARSRIELVRAIIEQVLLPEFDSTQSFSHLKELVTFLVSYFKSHKNSDIRQCAWEVLVLVVKVTQMEVVRSYLDKEVMRSLEKELKKNQNTATFKELRALTVKSSAHTGTRAMQKTSKTDTKATGQKKIDAQPKKKKTEKKETGEKANHCIFCDEYDPDFNEDTLITHYYDQCPILTNCPLCKTIVEVSTLSDHLLLEPEHSSLVKQCAQCKYPVPVEQWLQHVSKKSCAETTHDQTRCPFCQTDMTGSTETQWKHHLVNECENNPRK